MYDRPAMWIRMLSTPNAECYDSAMTSDQIVALLIAERDKLNRAIEALGRSTVKRRGRPPKNPSGSVTEAKPAAPAKKGRKTFSAAWRRAQAARMRAFWAKRKKAAK